eukprot:6239032-Alexandrium_andersonii.AAC.1
MPAPSTASTSSLSASARAARASAASAPRSSPSHPHATPRPTIIYGYLAPVILHRLLLSRRPARG